MARMHPPEFPAHLENDPRRSAEINLFEAFARQLDDEHHVFHGVAWLQKRQRHMPARDGETDFIIAHPRKGILVIEAKGGRIQRVGNGDWISIDRANVEHPIKDPIRQIRDSKYFLSERLGRIPEWGFKNCRFGHAVAFPDCANMTGGFGPDLEREILILAPDLAHMATKVDHLYSYWGGCEQIDGEIGSDRLDVLVRILEPTFRLEFSVAAQIRSSEREFAKPTDRQAMVLHNLCRNSRVIVEGNAGSGKTLLALETARYFARQGMRTLMTCFNRPLATVLAERTSGTANLTVLNYHTLCAEFAKQAGCPLEAPDETADKAVRDHYWNEAHSDALLEAIDRQPELRFDAIIVDEGQDFRESWWTALQMALVDPEDGILQIFHDAHQAIYIPNVSLPPIANRFALPQVLRNTRQIYEAGIRRFGIDALCLGPDGADVRWIACSADSVLRELKRVLHQLIHEEHIAPNDIAILTGHRPERSGIGRANAIGPHPVCVGVDDGHRVFVTTIHSFKGLEGHAWSFAIWTTRLSVVMRS